MPGILADVNVLGHFQVILRLMEEGYRAEIWAWLDYRVLNLRTLAWQSMRRIESFGKGAKVNSLSFSPPIEMKKILIRSEWPFAS